MILTIAWRELKSTFTSPFCWILLAAVQLVLGLFFFVFILYDFTQKQPALVSLGSTYGVTAYVGAAVLKSATLLLLLVVPVASGRLIADQRRSGAFALLQTAPLGPVTIVLGMYLAFATFVTAVVASVALLPLSLALGGPIDWGLLACALFGFWLASMCFAAVSLFTSTLSIQPIVGVITALCVLLGSWMLERAPADPGGFDPSLLASSHHLDVLLRGVLDAQSVLYFTILIAASLALAAWRLRAIGLEG